MTRNWFDTAGQDYARFRPDYPAALVATLASLAPAHTHALDVGCGSGQLTALLASHFDTVTGIDPSESQIAHATHLANVDYVVGAAEELPVPDQCADLVTVGQAAHWFDLPAFYNEVRRVCRPGGTLALVCYGEMSFAGDVDARFQQFYWDEVGPYWPPQRRLVEDGYRSIPFPFDEVAVQPPVFTRSMDLASVLGYIATWSAVRAAHEAGRDDVLSGFADEFTTLWGDPQSTREVTWPLYVRAGRVG